MKFGRDFRTAGKTWRWRWPKSPLPSIIPKWWTFRHMRWIQNLHQSTWDHEILYADRSSKEERLFIKTIHVINQKYERGGLLKVKIQILFSEETLEPLRLGTTRSPHFFSLIDSFSLSFRSSNATYVFYFPALSLQLWRWRQHFYPKRWHRPTKPHSAKT
jgi:hypothetical protein